MLKAEREGLTTHQWFRCLDTFIKRGTKTLQSYFSTITVVIIFLLAYSMTHFKSFRNESLVGGHTYCVY